MNNSIGWRSANKKEKWFNRDCPEWIWRGIFIACIIGLIITVHYFDRIEPGEVIIGQEVQIEQEVVKTPPTRQEMAKKGVMGVASWYDYSLNGVQWSKGHNTCAVRDFKRYSMIRVTNVDNGKSVDCYVNDYGPELGQTPERHVDLSSHAFKQIASLGAGLINVKIEELK